MKELFLKLSTLNGSLNGNRFVFSEVQIPEPMTFPVLNIDTGKYEVDPTASPDIQAKQQKSIDAIEKKLAEKEADKGKAPESSDQAVRDIKEEEMTFMDKVRLKSGMTTEARLSLEKQIESVVNKQEALNRIAEQLFKEAEAEGNQTDVFVNFNAKYGAGNRLSRNAADITYLVLSKLVDDPTMVRSAMDNAKGIKVEKAPQLVATFDSYPDSTEGTSDAEKINALKPIAIQLLGEAKAEGDKTGVYKDFIKKYNVNNPVALSASGITFSALQRIEPNSNIVQSAVDIAKKEVNKAKETVPLKPAKQPELVAQVAKKSPAKAPKLASVAKVAPKPKEATPNQADIKELADKVQKELPKDLAKALMSQIDKVNKANPSDIAIISEKVDDLLADFKVDKDSKKAQNEIFRLGINVGYAIRDKKIGGTEVAKK